MARGARWATLTSARRRTQHERAVALFLSPATAWIPSEPRGSRWVHRTVLLVRHRPSAIGVSLASELGGFGRAVRRARGLLASILAALRSAPSSPLTVVRSYDGETWDGDMPGSAP